MKALLRVGMVGVLTILQAQEAPPTAAIEGVQGVQQEGSGNVKPIHPSDKGETPRPIQGSEKVDGVEGPVTTKEVKSTPSQGTASAEGKPVAGSGAKGASSQPASQGIAGAQGIGGINKITGTKGISGTQGIAGAKGMQGTKGNDSPGDKTPAAIGIKAPQGGVKPIKGLSGIEVSKLLNLERTLQEKTESKPELKKAQAAAALLGQPPPKRMPAKPDDRKLFEEAQKIPDNGS